MKVKITTDGFQYSILVKKFPYLWWINELPTYTSIAEAKSACFRVYNIGPKNITIEKV